MRTFRALVAVALLFHVPALAGQAPDTARLGQPGVQAPRIVKETKPQYTKSARDAGIQGVVIMEAVVKTDGSVGDVTVKQSLDTEHGLDAAAVNALKQWKFRPGTRDGKPVPVMVDVEMSFALAKRK